MSKRPKKTKKPHWKGPPPKLTKRETENVCDGAIYLAANRLRKRKPEINATQAAEIIRLHRARLEKKGKLLRLVKTNKKEVEARTSCHYVSTFVVKVELEISDRVIKEALSPDWQKSYYKFENAQQVADHIAYNVARGAGVRSLDGFAHLENADIVIHEEDWSEED